MLEKKISLSGVQVVCLLRNLTSQMMKIQHQVPLWNQRYFEFISMSLGTEKQLFFLPYNILHKIVL